MTPLPDAAEAGAAAARHLEQAEAEAREIPPGNTGLYVNKHAALVADLKDSARRLTRRLVADSYVRPGTCERCGSPPPEGQVIQAHHIEYLRTELIDWLCPPCHRAEHPRPINWQQLWDSADHAA